MSEDCPVCSDGASKKGPGQRSAVLGQEQLGRRRPFGQVVEPRVDPLGFDPGHGEFGLGRCELGLDGLESSLGCLARIDGLVEVPMGDGQAIRDQRKGLLQLDLLGRRADR
jgi:hypothetical protein